MGVTAEIAPNPMVVWDRIAALNVYAVPSHSNPTP